MALTKQVEDARIPCTSAEQLQIELDKLADVLTLEEGEDTWEKLERAVIRFAGITRGGGYKFTGVFMEGVGKKGTGLRLVQCMLSDRGRLSGAATDLLATMAPRLSIHFAPLSTLYLPPIIKLLARPNKVFLRRAEKCLLLIMTHCPIPQLIPLVMDGVQDKNEQCRRACAVAVQKVLQDWDKVVIGVKVAEIEVAMRKMATDKDPEVRKAGKAVWERYQVVWPERVAGFVDPLTPTISRYLGIAAGTKAVKKAPMPTVNTVRPPAIGTGPRPAAPARTAPTSSITAPTRANTSRSAAEHPSISAVRAGKMVEHPAAISQPTSRPPVSRTTTIRNVSTSMDPPPLKSHPRSQSATEVPTESSIIPSLTSRGLGGLGRPVRPTPFHAATIMNIPAAATRKPGVLGGGPSRPVRLPSSLSIKNIAEDTSASSSSSRPVRPARVVSGMAGMSSIDRMAGAKNGGVPMRRVVSAATHSPTPKAGVADARALTKVSSAEALPHLSRSVSSSVGNDSEVVKRPAVSVSNRSGERIERPRAAFRPGPTSQATQNKPAIKLPTEGAPASMLLPAKVAVARVADQAQVHDPARPSMSQAVTATSPSPGEQTAMADRVMANGGFFEDVTATVPARHMPASDDATIFFPSFKPGEDLLRETLRDDDLADGTLSAESSGAAAAPPRRNIFAPPPTGQDEFLVPVGQPLSAKDVPLPPSPPGKSDSTLIFPPHGLQHKSSIARSIAASSSNETVPADWDSDSATDDGREDDPMAGVRFKSPSRQGQAVKLDLLKKSLGKGLVPASGRTEGSDLLQFSDDSDRLLASSRRVHPASFSSNVSPKIAALTQTLLSKSTNTLHSTPPTPQSSKSELLKSRAFTPIRSNLEKHSRTGSTTPAGTPPLQLEPARAMLGKKRTEGLRHGALARSN